ncbi:MAG: gamma-glutamyl-gamma-aminobutyrate hydrolase family protein [Gammaproteobacteria bacterium]
MNQDLIQALEQANYHAAKLLLQQGADPNARGEEGGQALEIAIMTGPEYLKLLLDHGATIRSDSGLSPVMLAYLVKQYTCIELLVQRKPDLISEIQSEQGPFFSAIRNQNREAVKAMMQWIDRPEETLGYTPLHRAVENHDIPLLENSLAYLNQTDRFGFTALHLAVLNQDLEMVRLLLAAGADKEIKTPKGLTAYELANQSTSSKMLEAFGEKKLISQNELEVLIQRIYWEGGDRSLSNVLKSAGFDTILKDIDLGYLSYFIGVLDTHDIDFIGCHFRGGVNNFEFSGRVENSEFSDFHCLNCVFDPGTLIYNSTFKNSIISYSDLHHAAWMSNEFFYTQIVNNYFHHASLYDNHFYGTSILNNTYVGSYQGQNEFIQSELDFEDSSVRTQPLIGLLGEVLELSIFSEPGFMAAEPYLRIKESGAIPQIISRGEINLLIEKRIEHLTVEKEVKSIINTIDRKNPLMSITESVLQADLPGIKIVKSYAKLYSEHLDALWIPGGPDVYAGFYGQADSSSWGIVEDLFELALINEMLLQNKPIIGVCHGAQILNVYFGGTLLQHVDGHAGVVQAVEVVHPMGRLGGGIVGETVSGYSNHHQAIDRLAESLEVVAQYDGVIKAAQGKEIPVWLTQFHPEYLLDDNNQKVLDAFFDAAKKHRQAQLEPLQLNDVLEMPTLVSDTLAAHQPMLTQTLELHPISIEPFG